MPSISAATLEAWHSQLLEQVGLLVGALGAAEAGQRIRAVVVANRRQTLRHEIERLVPGRFAKRGHDLGVVDGTAGPAASVVVAAHVARQRPLRVEGVAANERHGQPLGVSGVVPAVAPLHAQALLVARALPPLREHDGVARAVHVVGERAAHTAVGTDGVDGLELVSRTQRRRDGFVDEGSGGAHGGALAAGHAGALAHGGIEVEGDARPVALARPTQHLVVLQVVAGANAAIAEDAGLMVDGDHLGALVDRAMAAGGKCVARDVVAARQGQQLVVARLPGARFAPARRLVRRQQLDERRAVCLELRRGGAHLHVRLALPHARRGEHPLAHVHHAHATHADGKEPGIVAERGDLDAALAGGLPDRRTGLGLDGPAVDRELQGPSSASASRTTTRSPGPIGIQASPTKSQSPSVTR
jgi:hypothetical protein